MELSKLIDKAKFATEISDKKMKIPRCKI